MKKQILVSAVILAVVGASVFSTTHVLAQTTDSSVLVQMIADKFHVNKTDVQAVFDEHHKTRVTNMQARLETKLMQDVKSEKITEAQKTLILNKLKEVRHSVRQMWRHLKR